MHKKSHAVNAKDIYNQAGNVLDPNNKQLAEGFFSAGKLVTPPFKKGKGCMCGQGKKCICGKGCGY